MLREKLRNKKGFTLIEIIVVIVILAVLMAVAVPSVMSYMNEGQKAKYQAVARTVLINTQTEYAKQVAEGTYNEENEEKLKTTVQGKNYDGATVVISSIELTGDSSTKAEDKDIKSVTCTITIDTKSRNVKIDTNKKVEVS